MRLLLNLEGDRRIDVQVDHNDAIYDAFYYGHEQIIRLLISLEDDRKIDIERPRRYCGKGYLFQVACYDGHESIVRLLLGLEGDRRIDVHAEDEAAFQ